MPWNDIGTLLDDFNRADTDTCAADSANWTSPVFPGDGDPSIVSNTIREPAWASMYWDSATFGPDIEVDVECVGSIAGVAGAELVGRVQTPGTTGVDGYLAHFSGTTAQVYRIDNNVQTQIGSTGTMSSTPTTGDRIGLQCIGDIIGAYARISGSWSNWAFSTDSTYAAAGSIGMAINLGVTGPSVDNFRAGTYTSPYPKVETVAESADGSAVTSHTVTLPTGIQSGDLLVVVLAKGSTAATINALTGWTELLDENVATGFYVAYRKADGSEGASISLTSSAATRCASIVYRISNAADPAVQPPQVGTTATGSSTTPNPPSVSVTGGSKDILAIAALTRGGEEADDDTWATGQPSGYPGPTRQKASGTVGTNLAGMVAAAERQVTTSAEDPGTFTIATGAWRAQTIVVHPASSLTKVSNTRVLQYNMQARASQTRQLQNSVRAIVSNTRVLQSQVKTIIAQTRTLQYQVNARTTNTRQLQYAMAARAAQTRTLQAQVKVIVSNTRTLQAQVKQIVAGARTIQYQVPGRASAVRTIQYGVSGKVSGSRVLQYGVAGRVSATRALQAQVKVIVAGSRALQYQVVGRINQTRTLQHGVAARATQTRTVQYGIAGKVTQTRQVQYQVKVTTSSTRSLQYAVNARSSRTRTLQYQVNQTINRTRTLQYSIAGRASQTRTIQYQVPGRVASTRQIQYTVIQVGKVSQTRTIQYAVNATVNRTRTLQYQVKVTVAQTRALQYGVNTRASNQRVVQYGVAARASQTRTLQSNVYARTSRTRTLQSNVYARAAGTRDVRYAVSARVARTRELRWSVEQVGRVSQTTQVRYVIRTRASHPLVVTYLVRNDPYASGTIRGSARAGGMSGIARGRRRGDAAGGGLRAATRNAGLRGGTVDP